MSYTVGEVLTEPHPSFGEHAIGYRYLDDGRVIVLYNMLTNFRIVIGDDWNIENGWCYARDRFGIAWAALLAWDGEGDPPDGWHRNPFDGRRRVDGDPTREEVRR